MKIERRKAFSLLERLFVFNCENHSQGLRATLNIIHNDLKYEASRTKKKHIDIEAEDYELLMSAYSLRKE